MRKLSFTIIVILLLMPSVSADNSDLGRIFYDKAVSEYLQGSRDEAIKSMESSLKYSAGNDSAKKILARLLVQRSSDYFYGNEIEKSFIDIKEAKTVLPDDPQVDRLFTFVKTAFEERYKPASTSAPGPKEQKELVKYMAGAYLGNKSPVETGGRGLTRGEITWLIVIFAVGILLLFLAVLSGFDKIAQARERDIYSQRVELERVKWALAGHDGKSKSQPDPAYAVSLISAGLSKAPSEMERLLKNPYLAVRAKGLIILEAEMLGSDGKKRAAARLLDTLLMDRDPMVAANAARAMAQYDMNKAMTAIEKLWAGDRQQKTAAAHVLGWVRCGRSVKLLLKAANDKDGKIAAAGIKGLGILKAAGGKGMPPAAAGEIDRALSLFTIKK